MSDMSLVFYSLCAGLVGVLFLPPILHRFTGGHTTGVVLLASSPRSGQCPSAFCHLCLFQSIKGYHDLVNLGFHSNGHSFDRTGRQRPGAISSRWRWLGFRSPGGCHRRCWWQIQDSWNRSPSSGLCRQCWWLNLSEAHIPYTLSS